MAHNTGNLVGSEDPRDLIDNAPIIDKFATSQEAIIPDRLGDPLYTIRGMNELATGIPAVEASIRAEAAAESAQGSAAAALIGGDIYGSVAAGEAVAEPGQYFWSVSTDGDEIVQLNLMGVSASTRVDALPSILALITRLVASFPERTGWAWFVRDQLDQILMGLTSGGVFVAEGVEVVTRLLETITDLQAQKSAFTLDADPARTGILWRLSDAAGQMLIYLTTDLTLYVGGLPVGVSEVVLSRINALESGFAEQFGTNSDIVCWGDSMTEGAGSTAGSGNYPYRLSLLYGSAKAVSNQGVGGQNAQRISARANGFTTLVSVSGNVIPASGVVAATVSPALFTTPATTASRSRNGWLNGVYGNLFKDTSNNYTFTRASDGSAVYVFPQSVFTFDLGNLSQRISVIWSGTNDALNTPEDRLVIVGYIDQMIAAIPSLDRRYLVIPPVKGVTNVMGDPTYLAMAEMREFLKQKYKDRYVPVWETLVESYDPDNPQDVIDYSNGVVPSSLRSDGIHLNDAGYQIVANTVKTYIDRLGW